MRRVIPAPPSRMIRERDALGRIARGGVLVFGMQIAGAGLAFGMQVALAQWMGASEYGKYALAVALATVLAVLAGVGFPAASLRYIPEYTAKGEWRRLRGFIERSQAITITASVGLASLGALAIASFALVAGRPLATPLIVSLALVPPLALTRLYMDRYRAVGRVGLAFAPSVLIRPLVVIACGFGLFAYANRLDSIAALGLTLVAIVVGLLLQVRTFARTLPQGAFDERADYRTGEWMRVATPLFLIAGFVVILTSTDVLLIGAFMTPHDVGVYNAALKTAGLVGFVLTAVSAIAVPTFASLHAGGDREGLQGTVSTVAHWIFWPSLALVVVLVALSEQLLALFGSAFVAARPELAVLAFGQLVNAAAGSVGHLLNVTGHQTDSLRVYGWSALANVVFGLIAIPLLGTLGAALATAASMTLWNMWLYVLVVRRLGIHASVVPIRLLERKRG